MAHEATSLGFENFIVIAWDDENKWAATVSTDIDPKRLRDAAAFLLKAAGGQDG